MAQLFSEVFCWLPLAHVLNQKVMVVHGGLFARDGVTLDEIRQIDRNRCALIPSCLRGRESEGTREECVCECVCVCVCECVRE